jgi:hypothetical protein
VPDERMIFSHWRGNVAVRTQRYLLDHEGQLFDLIADPGQQRDIASEHRRVADELAGAVKQWRQEMLVEHEQDDRPFTVGYRDMPMTQLPARDGVPHGNVERSSRHPNCSFFTNWTGHDDRITWDIDVATAGEYEAVIYYTCPVADVGSTIELSFREASVQATVAEPHDPPLMGAEHDRVPRNNSYVKDFKPMRVGTLRLPAGRGTLTLRALDIPGKQVMDVRMIVLTLQ